MISDELNIGIPKVSLAEIKDKLIWDLNFWEYIEIHPDDKIIKQSKIFEILGIMESFGMITIGEYLTQMGKQ